MRLSIVSLVVLFSGGCSFSEKKESGSSGSSVAMDPAVYSLLSNRCTTCHSGANAPNGFSFITDMGKLLQSGTYVVPGNPDASLIYKKVTGADTPRMPYNGPYLSTDEISLIRNWITNLGQPSVTITSTASDLTNVSPIPFEIAFSAPVVDFTSSSPTVTNGAVSNFTASADKRTYTFDVTPSADGAVTVTVAADTASTSGGSKNLAAAPVTKTYDGTAPTITITSSESSPTQLTSIPITVTASEALSSTPSLADFVVGGGTTSGFTTVDSTHWSFIVAPSGQGDITINYAGSLVQDAVGNNNTAASQFLINYNGIQPLVTLAATSGDATASSTFTMSATLSAASTNFTAGDVSITGGSISGFYGSGTSYAFTVSPTHNADVVVSVAGGAFSDADGHPNASASKTIYYPTAALTYVKHTDQSAYIAASNASSDDAKNYIGIPLKITFSQDVNTAALDTGLSLTGTGSCLSTKNTVAESVTSGDDGNKVKQVTVKRSPASFSSEASSCNLTVAVPAGATYWTDPDSTYHFGNLAATTFSMPYTPATFSSDVYDLVAPRLANGTVKNSNACINCHRADKGAADATLTAYLSNGTTAVTGYNGAASASFAMTKCAVHSGVSGTACSGAAFTVVGGTNAFGLGTSSGDGSVLVSTTADLTSGSPTMTVASATNISAGMTIIGTGIPRNTTVNAVAGTTITLSENATANGTGVAIKGHNLLWKNFVPTNKTVDGKADSQFSYKTTTNQAWACASGDTALTVVDSTGFTVGDFVSGTGLSTSTNTTAAITSGSPTITVASATNMVAGRYVVGYGLQGDSKILTVVGTTITLDKAALVTETAVPVQAYNKIASITDGTHITVELAATAACTGNYTVLVPIVNPGLPLKSALFLKVVGSAQRITGDLNSTSTVSSLANFNWFDLTGVQRNAMTYIGSGTVAPTPAVATTSTMFAVSSEGGVWGKFLSAAPGASSLTLDSAASTSATGVSLNLRPLSDLANLYKNSSALGTSGSLDLGGNRMPAFSSGLTTNSNYNPIQATAAQQAHIYNWILDGAHNN